MKKVLLLLFIFLLNSCSLDYILALGEVDKTQVVKRSYYMKHYRAYFTRTNLKPIIKNKKYRYFYNARKRDLTILLHPGNRYILYSLYDPSKRAMVIYAKHKTKYGNIVKSLKKRGYRPIFPIQIGCISHVSLRKYKGIKTILVDVKDYSNLRNVYQKAIRNYDGGKIKNIRTKLPKQLISSYYDKYYKRAKTKQQLKALQIIAKKLQLPYKEIKAPSVKKPKPHTKPKPVSNTKPTYVEEVKEEEVIEKIEEENVQDTRAVEIIATPVEQPEKSFDYYLHDASHNELSRYISTKQSKKDLSRSQYAQLTDKVNRSKEEKLLKNGSLEELILAYKKNKKLKYKARILELLKKVQESK